MENTQLTTETLSLMTLGALPGVGLKTLRTILTRYDSAMAALEALAQGADVCACSGEDLAEARRWAEAEMAYCEAHAVRILTLTIRRASALVLMPRLICFTAERPV